MREQRTENREYCTASRRAPFSYSLILLFSVLCSLFSLRSEAAPAARGRPAPAPATAGARTSIAKAPTAPAAAPVAAVTAAAPVAAIAAATPVEAEPEPEPEEEYYEEEIVYEEPEPEPIAAAPENTEPEVENKNLQFGARFGLVASDSNNEEETPLQKIIREQRAKLFGAPDADGGGLVQKTQTAKIGKDTAVQCDEDLRGCMAKKCGGADWVKCWKDGDTDWGMKMDSCRRDSKCTGEEYGALAPEIKADRDQNNLLSRFSETISCGKTYNNCLVKFCGDEKYGQCIDRNGNPAQCKSFANQYQKCWSKSGGDKAISACEKEYKKCQESDSGLQARAMELFANLRVGLEKNILNWEEQLYKLRDSMTNMCKMTDGMFDNRSLQCVYTVELYADNDGKSTQFASKKMHGGETYTCNPDSFGIDITTFRENAYRLTRSQTAASSAMLGAGAGVAVGALTSGAIGRAIDSQKAAKEAKKAEENMAGTTADASKPESGTADEAADTTEGSNPRGGSNQTRTPEPNPQNNQVENRVENRENNEVAEEEAPPAKGTEQNPYTEQEALALKNAGTPISRDAFLKTASGNTRAVQSNEYSYYGIQ